MRRLYPRTQVSNPRHVILMEPVPNSSEISLHNLSIHTPHYRFEFALARQNTKMRLPRLPILAFSPPDSRSGSQPLIAAPVPALRALSSRSSLMLWAACFLNHARVVQTKMIKRWVRVGTRSSPLSSAVSNLARTWPVGFAGRLPKEGLL